MNHHEQKPIIKDVFFTLKDLGVSDIKAESIWKRYEQHGLGDFVQGERRAYIIGNSNAHDGVSFWKIAQSFIRAGWKNEDMVLNVTTQKPLGDMNYMVISRPTETDFNNVTQRLNDRSDIKWELHESEGCHPSITAWHPIELQRLLDANSSVLLEHHWPTLVKNFLQNIEQQVKAEGPIADLIALAYADPVYMMPGVMFSSQIVRTTKAWANRFHSVYEFPHELWNKKP